MKQHFLVRYGELALKGHNRLFFEEMLVRNIERALADLGPVQVRRTFGRILVSTDAASDEAAGRLRQVFGVVSLSPVRIVDPDPAAITETAAAMVADALATRPDMQTFKVDTRRADKRFPLPSMETSALVGAGVRARFPQLRAQMRQPDLLVQVEIRDAAYIATRTLPGPGGLPVGTGGRALPLISGGIDSPVAAWLGARRGLSITPVHFHSFPFTSERATDKVVDLCRVLAPSTGPLALWIVGFTEVQRAIQQRVPDGFRVIAMRRMMMRISEQLAHREGALALITGESLGQVASQTLASVAAIDAATALPVLRPLIGADKTEIVARAEAIGTYAISIRPYEDCCSLFLPAHPRTQPSVAEAEAADAGLDIPALVRGALDASERVDITTHRPVSVRLISSPPAAVP